MSRIRNIIKTNMCDNICASYLTIVVAFTLCSPARSEMKNETKRQRSIVFDLRSMISDLFDKDDVNENPKERDRKSVDSEGPIKYKKTQLDNLRREGIDDVMLLPLYPCDEFDEGRRSCTSVRQIGTTLTFGVHIEVGKNVQTKYLLRWFRFFKVFKSESVIKEELRIDRKPWNINFGEENTELRISPITETDFSNNYFVAFLVKNQTGQKADKLVNFHYLKFYLQPLPIDMGTLYHGEELFINVRSFVELPESSVAFDWVQSDVDKANNFPRNTRHVSSNMKKNADGSTLIIKEFMDSSDKILTCDVYSNKNVLIAKRDFLLRKIAEPDDTQKDFEEEVIHERRRRSLRDNYEYPSDSDKNEASGDSYASVDDVKVVNVDSSDAKRNIKKSPLEILNKKLPVYTTRDLQYLRHNRIPSSASYRERQPVESSYDRQSSKEQNYGESLRQNLGRYPANSHESLNELPSIYNIQDFRSHRQYILPGASVYGKQQPSATSYNKQLQNEQIYSEQMPNAFTYGKQLKRGSGEQPPNAYAYGKQSPNALTNDGETPNGIAYAGQQDQTNLKYPYLKSLIKQANSIAHPPANQNKVEYREGNDKLQVDHPPATQKSVEYRDIDVESQTSHYLPTQRNESFRKVDTEPQGPLTFDDMESKLISSCRLDSDCGIHAFCYSGLNPQSAVLEPMFCRCKNDYVGNGIFCWLF